MFTPSRRRRLERLFASAGGGGGQVAFDSPNVHPLAWWSDKFDYPDTATMLAALRAKTGYIAAYEDNVTAISIDNTVQIDGHNTLRITDVPGNIGMYWENTTVVPRLWIRYRVIIPADYAGINFEGIDVVDNPTDFVANQGVGYQNNISGDTGQHGWMNDFAPHQIFQADTLASIKGTSPIIISSFELTTPTNFRIGAWKDGARMGADFDITLGSAVAGLSVFQLNVATVGGVANLSMLECVAGDAPYSGLDP